GHDAHFTKRRRERALDDRRVRPHLRIVCKMHPIASATGDRRSVARRVPRERAWRLDAILAALDERKDAAARRSLPCVAVADDAGPHRHAAEKDRASFALDLGDRDALAAGGYFVDACVHLRLGVQAKTA